MKNKSTTPIEAILFDMDGLLIDSEPFWRIAMKKVFAEVGIDLTEEMAASTMGYRMDEVVALWMERLPWEGRTIESVTQGVVDGVCDLVRSDGQAMEGVNEILELFHRLNIPMGLASSSNMQLIETVIARLDLAPHLKIWHSAEFEAYGKPHPQVFITAAEKMGVNPDRCLVFEDSLNGVISGKAAKMRVVAIPDPSQQKYPGFGVADLQLTSLLQFDQKALEALAAK